MQVRVQERNEEVSNDSKSGSNACEDKLIIPELALCVVFHPVKRMLTLKTHSIMLAFIFAKNFSR